MFSPGTDDSGSEAVTSLPPPLQGHIRLARAALVGDVAGEKVVALKKYLVNRCASSSFFELVQRQQTASAATELLTPNEARDVSSSIAAREVAVKKAAADKASEELVKARAVKAEATAAFAELEKSSSARLSRLAATESEGGLVVLTATIANSTAPQAPQLQLRTHRFAAAAVAPFLTAMATAAETGDLEGVVGALTAGVSFLEDPLPAKSECYGFGLLELYRHFFIYVYSFCSPGDAVQWLCGSQPRNDIRRALDESVLPYEEGLREDIAELHSQRQQTDQLASCARLIARVIQEYCVFFHATMSVAEALARHFYHLAAGLHPADGAVYGTARFPNARHCILQRQSNNSYRTKMGRNAIDGRPLSVVCSAFSPESNRQDKVMPTATAGRVDTLTEVLSLVIAPGTHTAAFILLSALATLPLSAALEVVVTVNEVRTLYHCSPILTALVGAMWRGRLGDVWTQSQRAAQTYLSEGVEPLMASATYGSLLPQVRNALCYQYASCRSVVDLGPGAAYLGLSGGVEELLEELEPLIVSGRLPMRINVVDKMITRAVPPSAVDAGTVAERALENSRLSLAEGEMTVRQLAVQRNLVQTSFATLPLSVREAHFRK